MNISIVIPVYNGEETLENCLESIANIDYPNDSLDILLINDGSTDKTLEIAEKYKNIRIITLEKNSGRIIARETGAKEAKYDDILFVDARIEVAKDIIRKIEKIDYSPLMAGELLIDKYSSDYDTLFYLIRRKIYSPYFPQNKYSKELWINKHNFANAPKGTGCLFLKRKLFLDSLPKIKSSDTNDDTKILKYIVFEQNTKILRHTEIVAKYNQRTQSDIFSWIHHRGRMWADHYLSFINKYSIAYAVINLILIALLIKSIYSFIGMLFILFFISAVILAENSKDIIIVLRFLPILSLRFYAGTLERLYKKLKSTIE